MKDMRSLAIGVIFLGLLSLVLGGIGKWTGTDIVGFSPRVFAMGTGICFLLSINLLLLNKKS